MIEKRQGESVKQITLCVDGSPLISRQSRFYGDVQASQAQATKQAGSLCFTVPPSIAYKNRKAGT